ncbi:MAG: nuclear transport factor 2 family protein [Steroidobacteraceae bacterium]
MHIINPPASRRLGGAALGAALLMPLLLGACGGNDAQFRQLQDEVRQLKEQLDATQLRMTHIEDVKAIEKLTRAYGYYIDKGLWSQVVNLFAEDGTVQLGGEGIYKGREGVARQFSMWFGKDMGRGPGKDGLAAGVLFNHPQFQGIVDVDADGTTAHGRWRTLAQVAWQGRIAFWNEGVYENEYVKEDGVWKFKHMKFWPTYFTLYNVGWDRQGVTEISRSANTPNKEFPPDEPSPAQDTKSMYPEHYFVPPFHYPNPVTGTPVQSPGAP